MLPADADQGIHFCRVDIAGRPVIRVSLETLRSMSRWTSFEQEGIWVHHSEHILASIALAGVDNVIIEIDGEWVPFISGGRARPFYEAIMEAGLQACSNKRKVYRLRKPLIYIDRYDTRGNLCSDANITNRRYIVALPSLTRNIVYIFDWAHLPRLPVGIAEYVDDDDKCREELLDARSYLVGDERIILEKIIGDIIHDVMILNVGCDPLLCREAAKHKIVDVIGDMMAAGVIINAHFIHYRTGHRIHHEFLKHIIEADCLSLEELDGNEQLRQEYS